ncbi:MAG: N-acetyltransferase [Bacteroidota bacterium]
MEGNITIERARPDQAGSIAELFDAYRVFYDQPSDITKARAYIHQRLQRAESVIFMACIHLEGTKIPAGFTQTYPSFSSLTMSRIWILNDLYVAEKFRELGIGKKLVLHTVNFARENYGRTLFLETGLSNYPAQRLYDKLGFSRDRHFAHYYFDL